MVVMKIIIQQQKQKQQRQQHQHERSFHLSQRPETVNSTQEPTATTKQRQQNYEHVKETGNALGKV